MKHLLRRLARALLPEPWWQLLQRRYCRVRWTGDYSSWAEARAASGGYDAPRILERVRAAASLVRAGGGAYERDGVVFAAPDSDPLLLDCLNRAARSRPGGLNVLDFGGSLGSTYWQHRSQLEALGSVIWRVVEQPAFAEVGAREFAEGGLRFFPSVAAACAEAPPDVVLLCSVLPYLESPHLLLAELVARRAPWILIGRTGLVDGPADRLTIQHVPRTIYPASYPCWFVSRARLLAHFSDSYILRREERTADGHDTGFTFWNLVFEIRSR